MRKILAVLLAVVLVIPTLAACDLGGAPEDNVPPAHEHTVVIDDAVAPTCTSTGLTVGAHCSECGDILVKQEIIPVSTEHTYDDEYDAVCNVCGHTREVSCAHTTLETLPAKDATCKESGLTEGTKCSDCGTVIAEQEIVPVSAEHTYDDEYDAVCNVCGYTREVDCAHTTLETLPAKDATCKESGLTEGKKCSDCGEILVEQQVLPTTEDHSFIDRVCEICGEINYSKGLAYTVIDSETCYISGIGSCTDLDIKIPEYIDGYKVTSIGEDAFFDCSSLTSVKLPDSVTSISAGAFYGCSSLTNVVLTDSITNIGDYAFVNCSSLTRIVIPNNVTSIGDHVFSGCSSLTSVQLPDRVTNIGYYTFSYCSSLTSIIFPDSVTSIDTAAFAYCSSLTSIVIPNSVTSIGYSAFGNCSSLESIIVKEGNTVYHSAGNCLIETATKILIAGCKNSVIPADGSVAIVGGGAFDGCSGLTNIVIPDSITIIAGGAFYGCGGFESIIVDQGNTVYHSAGNCIIETETKTLIRGCKNSVIPTDGSVTSIGYGAFSGCSDLTNIVIPDSVTSIDAWAFSDCSSLTSIVIPDSVTSIGYGAFFDCSNLTSIVISDSVTSIGERAFYNCSSLTSIVIPDSVTSIGESAFYNCGSLTSIVIPDGVKSISRAAFSDCSSLTSIVIPDSVTSIGDWAFYNCDSLTSIEIPDSVTSIGSSAFEYCYSLTSIEFGGTKAQWNAISKVFDWNYNTGNYTVHCTDGDITK